MRSESFFVLPVSNQSKARPGIGHGQVLVCVKPQI